MTPISRQDGTLTLILGAVRPLFSHVTKVPWDVIVSGKCPRSL